MLKRDIAAQQLPIKREAMGAVEESKEEESLASSIAHGASNAAAGTGRLFKSMMDAIRKPFSSPTIQRLKENLFMAPHFALLGEDFPNLEAKSTRGQIKLHNYFGDGWGIVLTHPQAFEPVSLTELASAASMLPEFARRDCKLCAVSTGSLESHLEWTSDLLTMSLIGTSTGAEESFPIPILIDEDRAIAHRLGTLDGVAEDKNGEPLMARAVFIVGPDRKLRFSQVYPNTCGRNMVEILRVLDAVQRTENRVMSTPAGWTVGKDCMVNADANLHVKDVLFPLGVKERKLSHLTLNFTPDPQVEDRTLLHYVSPPKPAAHHVSFLNLGDEMPNFDMSPMSTTEQAREQEKTLRDFLGHTHGAIVCTLADPFSPVCMTEVAEICKLAKEFESRACKVVVVIASPISRGALEDAMDYGGLTSSTPLPFALVLDVEREIIAGLGALDEKVRGVDGQASVARALFVINPELKLKLSMHYPTSVARNWHEVLRVIDSLKLTDSAVSLLTPEGWKPGDEVVVEGSMTSDQVESFFPTSSLRQVQQASKRAYLRYVKDPTEGMSSDLPGGGVGPF